MFAEDLTVMFDEVDGFATPAVYKGVQISVIYDDAYFLVQGEDVGVDSTKPAAICRASDVTGVSPLIALLTPLTAQSLMALDRQSF